MFKGYTKRESLVLGLVHTNVNFVAPSASNIGQFNRRHAFELDSKKKYIFAIRALSFKFNDVLGNIGTLGFQSLVNSFIFSDTAAFVSVIQDDINLRNNTLPTANHTSAGGGVLVSTSVSGKVRLNETVVKAFTHKFFRNDFVNTGAADVTGDYFLPVPQSSSNYTQRSDIVPIRDEYIQLDNLIFRVENETGFLVPNFVTQNIRSLIFTDQATGDFLPGFDPYQVFMNDGIGPLADISVEYFLNILLERYEYSGNGNE